MHLLHLLQEKGQLGEVKLSEYQSYVLTCECQSDFCIITVPYRKIIDRKLLPDMIFKTQSDTVY